MLHYANCFDYMRGMDERSVDLIVTDPPYGITPLTEWDKKPDIDKMWKEFERILKPEGVVVIFANFPFTAELVVGKPDWFRYSLVWSKGIGTDFLNAKRKPLKSHEDILIFSPIGYPTYNPQMVMGKPYFQSYHGGNSSKAGQGSNVRSEIDKIRNDNETGERYPKTVLEFPIAKGGLHPTQKPLKLIEWLIKTYSNVGETVFDPFAGSGTTLVAAKQVSRIGVGCEMNEGFYQIAKNRLSEPIQIVMDV